MSHASMSVDRIVIVIANERNYSNANVSDYYASVISISSVSVVDYYDIVMTMMMIRIDSKMTYDNHHLSDWHPSPIGQRMGLTSNHHHHNPNQNEADH